MLIDPGEDTLAAASFTPLTHALIRTSTSSQDVLRRLLESDGRGEDAVKLEAQKLLNAFHINALL